MKNTNETKMLKIEPKGATIRYNAESGIMGECNVLENMRERNSSVEATGEWETCGNLRENEKILIVDSRNGKDYHLTYTDDGTIYLHGVREGDDYSTLNEKLCNVDAKPLFAQIVGPFVVIFTQQGKKFLYKESENYILADLNDAMPLIELRAVNTTIIDKNIQGKNFKNSYTQWIALEDADNTALQSSVISSYAEIKREAMLRGVFLQPVAVRYALRLWDDSYALVSPPIVVGKGVQCAGMVSFKVNTSMSGYETGLFTAEVYNVGIKILKSMSPEWQSLVKSIDILVSDEMTPFVENSVHTVCGTATDAGRYVSCQLLKKEWELSFTQVINPTTWYELVRLNPQDIKQDNEKVLWRKSKMIEANRSSMGVLTTSMGYDRVQSAGFSLNSRLYAGGNERILRNKWHCVQFFDKEYDNVPCEVIVTAHLRTHQGKAVVVSKASYAYTPRKLNGVIAYPDSRAYEMTVKLLSNGKVSEWSGNLRGVIEQGYACYVNSGFRNTELSAGLSFYEPTEQNTREINTTELVVYRNGNPFVTEDIRDAWQGEITAIVPTPKSVYSSVFGRYPVYVFTTKGLFAAAYKSLGNYKDVQMLDSRRLKNSKLTAVSDEKVYFVSEGNELCTLAGKTVTVISQQKNVSQLVWLNHQRELLVRHSDNSVHIELPNGRCYSRTEKLKDVYSDEYNALATCETGEIVDLDKEKQSKSIVRLETHPISVKAGELVAPLGMMVNITGSGVENGKVELIGSDGVSCEERVLTEIELPANCCHPLDTVIYAKPCRLIKLRVEAMCDSGLILRNVVVYYR